MMHHRRRHYIKAYNTLDELVAAITRNSWTLCSGFRWRSIVLLNDATSEDAAQEYAVVKMDTDVLGEFIESLTVSWMKPDELRELIERYEREGSGMHLGAYVRMPHPEGSCHACA